MHLFGLSADMDPIIKIAKERKLAVIEDAACGFGSFCKGSHVGTFGDTGWFSFHPRKAITTGEGGMITTSSNELSQKLSRLRDHGASASDLQRHKGSRPYLLADHPDAGFNQRMTDIQSALGSKQMDRAELIVEERKKIAEKAKTIYKVIDKNFNSTLLEMKPITGRKHQLRKQLFNIGHSIYGDSKYKSLSSDKGINKNLMLHSYEIKFNINKR